MSQNQLVTVAFNGQSILATIVDGKPYVAMKPICDNIGLQWEAQHKRIQRHPVLKSTMSMTDMVAEDGKQREMLCLPLSKLNGWLFGVDVNRVKEEIRPKLIRYQEECFDVLAQHFMPAARPFNPALDYDRISPAQKQDLKEIVHAIAKAGIQKYDETWARLHNKFRVNAYHELPATRYEDARAYLLGKLPEDTCTTMTPTPQPLSADRARAAFDAATRAAGEVQRTVFDAVMSGNDDWKHQRLLLAFVTDSAIAAPAYVRPIESGSLIATWARLIEDIRHGECLNSTADLFEMASACMQRLSTRQQTSAKALVL